MPSVLFTESNKFSKTYAFSNSDKFSYSNKFSKSESFSISSRFTFSDTFSYSSKFSQSSHFTNTEEFSESHQFSNSAKFSQSDHFSASVDFSPSIIPELLDPTCGFWESGEFNVYNDCDFINNDNKLVYINVLSSNFTNYVKKDDDGGAIHLINCGIHCNETVFVDCVSSFGGGGAIYINNTLDMQNKATFIDLMFLRCKASYGGAVFIYTTTDLFDISFTRCKFESNEALKHSPSNNEDKYFYGGNAVFLIAKKSDVINCSFVNNKGAGGSIKIYNKYEGNRKIEQLEENENTFSILGCLFEEANSKGAINFIQDKSGNNLDIIDCQFKGNLKKGFHYIDGKMLNKEKLRIKSCNFEIYKNNSLNIDLIEKLPIRIDKLNRISILAIVSIVIFGALTIFVILKVKSIILQKCNDNYCQNCAIYVDSFYDENLYEHQSI